MKRNQILGTAIVFALSTASVTTFGQSLSEAVSSGLNNSPKVREAIETAKASYFDVNVAKSSLRPQISTQASSGAAFRDRSVDGVATGSGETRFSREARVTVQQLLFDWGAAGKLVESADLRKQFQDLLVDDVRESQAMVIANTYLDIYRYRLRNEAFTHHLSELSKLNDQARERENDKGKTEGIVIRSKIASSKAKQAQLSSRVKALESRFKILTGMDAADLTLPRAPRDLAQVTDLADSPRLKAAKIAVASSQSNVVALKKDQGPKIFLEGRAGLGEDVLGIDGPDNEWSALAVLRWNPYEGGRKKALVNKAQREVARDEAAVEDVELVIKDDVALAQAELDGAIARYAALEEAKIELNEAVTSYSQLVFDAGEAGGGNASLLNVVNTRTELLNAEAESFDALVDSYRASYRGMEAAGQLLQYLGVE